ncbi:MAG: PAS domain S-box protein [Bacteroidetes bacterium]|nr:PAS domain S-box protein [Bacteroidota bacterium]
MVQGKPKQTGTSSDLKDALREEKNAHSLAPDKSDESEFRFRSIFENAVVGYFFIDKDGIIRDVNPAWVNLYKYNSKEEIIGRHFAEIQKLEDRELANRFVDGIMQGEKQYMSGEFSRLCRDGTIGYHDFTALPVSDGKEVKGIEGFIVDTTFRKQIEEQLEQNEERFKSLFNTMLQGVVYQDAEGKIILANSSAQELLGLSLDQIQGRSLMDPQWKAIHEDGSDYPWEDHPAMIALKSGKTVTNALMGVYNPQARSYKWLLINATPLFRNKEQVPYQVYTIFSDFTELKLANTSLQMSEKRLMNLYTNMGEGVALHKLVFDEQGEPQNYRIIGINPRFEQIIGIREKDVIDKLATEAYHVVDPPFFKEYLDVVKTGMPFSFEVFFPPLDKSFSISVSPWDKDGFATIFTDITERKGTEEALRESENKYRTIFENVQDVFFQVDADGKIIDISPSIHKYSGYERQELIGKPVEEVYFNRDDRDMMISELQEKEQVADYDIKLKTKSGELKWASISVHLVRDAEGKPAGLEGSLREVTARKQAEEKLQESEVKFRSLAENSPYAIMIYQKDFWVYCNQAAEAISGFTSEELYKQHFWEFVAPEYKETVQQIGKKRQIGDRAPSSYEFRIITKSGQSKWVFLTGNATVYEGRSAGIISVVDVSDRKRMELELKAAVERAQESDRLKSSFLANMSHEIRTPMNAILGFSELIGQPETDPLEQERFTMIIRNAGKRLLHIIDDIIDLSKLEAKQITISRSPCNLLHLVNTIVESFRNMDLLKKKTELRLVSDIADCLPGLEVDTDAVRLQQILDNLISNAIKYTSKGTITVGLRRKQENNSDYIEFFVKDTGKGIPSDKLSIIFERFRQVEENEYHEGSGLGLSICKAFAELLGGYIQVESEVGKGSIFTFTIPFVPLNAGRNPVILITGKKSPDLSKKTILIAEDEADSYLYLEQLLKETNAKLLRAENGQTLMEMIATSLPDLLLLDINMPGLTGYECLIEIRKKGYPIKVIAQTAYAMTEERKRLMEAGCNAYLAKPFSKKDLFESIAEVFGEV